MKRILAGALAATGVFGQGKGPMADTTTLIEKGKLSAVGLNQFGAKLVAAEAAAKPHANVFVSPLSVYLALAMTEAGSAGKTRTAIRRALAVPDSMSDQMMQDSASALMESLRRQRGVELSIANALWSSTTLPMAPAFIEKCKAAFDADARSIDFQKADAADIINRWVSEKTKTKIPSIVSPDAVKTSIAMLTNAIYFMGRWQLEFNEGQTANADFTLADRKTRKVRMMHQDSMKNTYRKGDGFEAAALGYKNSAIQMFAILPAQGVSPEQALAKATPEKLISGDEPYEVDLKLPKFSLDFESALKAPLTKLGMGIAFEYPGAEFAPMGSPLFYLSQVTHKTRLEVDEKGTVAAAATVVAMMAGSAAPMKMEKKVLVFNRPFAVVIADAYTGAVLFNGVVYEP